MSAALHGNTSVARSVEGRVRRPFAWLPFVPGIAFALAHVLFGAWALAAPSFVLVRTVYDTDTLLFPFLFLGGAVAARYTARRTQGLTVACAANALLAVCMPAVRVYATHVEPEQLVVHHKRLESPHAPRVVRILHMSDIQADVVGDHERRAFDAIRDLAPSLVIHTGDLLQPIAPATRASELPKLEKLVSATPVRHGFITVLGDVDGWLARSGFAEVAGMRVLRSESTVIDADGTLLSILGLSLAESKQPALARPRILHWLHDAPQSSFKIVVGHAPDFVLGAEDLPINLALAGHTHGGQIRLPWFGPLITLSQVPREWARGFRSVGRVWLNVSAGVGSEHQDGLPAIRLNCPPELTLLSVERTAG
jgi:predicted MPP superfamily phosphohydrolase